MLTIINDNTMILDTINDRQDRTIVASSTMMRGLERLVAHLLRAVVPVVAVCTYPVGAARAAESCRHSFHSKCWQPSLGSSKQLPGVGQPVGSGRILAG
ncbi:RING finger protein [Aeoliella mucimassa]|uniref:Uncharacterized protein n=1 Tax=Aeoliella mucimassa TaxID=2527972 RepID=A0A518ATR3_9BACT|nr:hypothetical protein [Aeoliella mucimassa]QDU58095.1 hypothetical protein Pan181_43210 [Aeoliella mucimassa]